MSTNYFGAKKKIKFLKLIKEKTQCHPNLCSLTKGSLSQGYMCGHIKYLTKRNEMNKMLRLEQNRQQQQQQQP